MSYLATDTGYDGTVISLTKLNKNKVFVAYSHSNTNLYLYGVVCTIDGTVITSGLPVQLSSIKNSGKIISMAALQDKVVIVHSYESISKLYSVICKINGTTITKRNRYTIRYR